MFSAYKTLVFTFVFIGNIELHAHGGIYGMKKYLFITVPNNSGSSFIYKVVGNCKNAAALPGCLEGQHINGIGKFMPVPGHLRHNRMWTEIAKKLSDESRYDWDNIKKLWNKGWGRVMEHKGDVDVLVEKSPPNVIRAPILEKNFKNSYFLLMLRNPYAFCEGIRRRSGWPLKRCANHWVRCTRYQIHNMKVLRNKLFFTYEEMCGSPKRVLKRIVNFMPELDDASFDGIRSHSIKGGEHKGGVYNFNEEQLKNLGDKSISKITRALRPHGRLLKKFGYSLIP